MVDGGSAGAQDTGLVGRPVGGIDGDRDGGLGEGVGEVGAAWDIDPSADLQGSTVNLAGLVSADVGVLVLGGDSVVLDVAEGRVHPSTVAAVVAIGLGAVDQLLLGEELLGLAGDEQGALKGSDGREGPAGSAGSLVLDASDLSGSNPVDVAVDIGGPHGPGVGVGELPVDLQGEVHAGELLLGQIGELVDSHLVGLGVVGVVGVDLGHILLEDGLPVLLLELRVVHLTMSSLPLLELRLVVVGLHVQQHQRRGDGD